MNRFGQRCVAPLALLVLACAGNLSAQNWGAPVWSDEFNGAANSAPDLTKWTYDVGNLNVNNEVEVYCANPLGASPSPPCDAGNPNAYQDGNGNLVIKAIKTASGTWTSARLKTQGITAANFQYGRLEARMKLPSATGLWPAFWMLGTNITSVGWPQSGEVDIMENVLTAPLGATRIQSTIHGPGYSGANGIGQGYTFPNAGRVDDNSYHIYGAIWSPYLIQFYVDDPTNIFFAIPASGIPSGAQWVYNNNFFLIMNLAVGGNWPGPPDGTTPNPSLMYVDYVRVYKAAAVPGPGMTASSITVTAGQTGTSAINLSSTQGTGKVYLACSNAPANSTCSISPAYVDFSSSPAAIATLNLTTQAHTSASRFHTRRFPVVLSLSVLVFGLLVTPGRRPSRKTTRLILGIVVLGVFGMGLNSCGGGGSGTPTTPTPVAQGGTPSGTYTLTITGYTVSGDQSTMNVPITVK